MQEEAQLIYNTVKCCRIILAIKIDKLLTLIPDNSGIETCRFSKLNLKMCSIELPNQKLEIKQLL